MKHLLRMVLYRFSQLLAWLIFMLLFRIRRYGARNIPSPPFVILSTHQSFLDPVIVGFTCPHPVRYMARSSLFRNPLFSLLIRAYGAFEIERNSADFRALKKTLQFLKKGESVLLFPEGTRTMDGRVGRMKPGGLLVAAKADVPVLPAVIEGAFQVWSRNNKLPRFFLPIRIYYGKPIKVTPQEARETASWLTEKLEAIRKRLNITVKRKEHNWRVLNL